MSDVPSTVLLQWLFWGVVPLWLSSGVGDWACHRAQRIERTAGFGESALHLAMLAQLGAGVFLAVAFEPSHLQIGWMAAAAVAHEATMVADLFYASHRRRIAPFEQWVHGVQHAMPWVALGLWALAHWPTPEDTGLQWRAEPWAAGWWVAGLGGAVVGALFAEEAWRTRTVHGGTRVA